MSNDVYAEYRTKFAALGEQIAERKRAAESVLAELEKVNAQIESLRARQQELVEQKSQALGGQSYIDLKKHYAALAKLLSGK
jgi:hypothetical protein